MHVHYYNNFIIFLDSMKWLFLQIPELIAMYQDGKKKGIFLAANVGFVLGVVFMLLLAIFEEYITI